ncbi:MAG: ABC transporter ATP-binding protein [Deltaproteobacteria bacterium]|nr:ABC transporter ATP-binding protein [Deltaproteobacteria bacterium]
MLELENVHKFFAHDGFSIHVLRGIDLIVGRGESLAVIGASGAGKSTLLNIMGTLEPPSQGVVRFESRSLHELNERELCALRSRKIGFVFQFHHLLPEFNALENAAMPALIARAAKKEAMGKAGDILVKVGLGQRLNHRVGELSGGEQQRVAIARALVMQPTLLLADEPTGNLDAVTGEGIVDLLLQLNEEHSLTLVIATHNQHLAERMSKHVEITDGLLRFQR